MAEKAKFIYHVEIIFEGDNFKMAEGSDLPGGMQLSDEELNFCNHAYQKLHNAFKNLTTELDETPTAIKNTFKKIG